ARPRDGGSLDRSGRRLDGPGADGRRTDAGAGRRLRTVGASRSGHAGRDEARGPGVPATGEAMAYTLSGRLQSRLVAALVPLLVACVLAGGAAARAPRGVVRGVAC